MPSADLVVCVDFGSTFTKAALVDLAEGRIVAAASHPTTIPVPGRGGDVLDGYDACRASLTAAEPGAATAQVLACSSAGGGLRIAVVGNEELVTAEAGRRVALSSGGKVVAVLAASRALPDAAALAEAAPDLVLLTGGTDGGNTEVLLDCTRALVAAGWRGPVVVAGNVAARDQVAGLLTSAGVPHVLADNVLPRIGELAPGSARAAIREMFLTHVIGGKELSARVDHVSGRSFAAMVRGATPDVVLTGVELLAHGLGPGRPGAGDVVVVDVGGATTDVHSVVEVDPEVGARDETGLARDVVASTPVTRTVEADLGMRWSAVSTVDTAELHDLREAAAIRQADPAFLPTTDAEVAEDEAIARAAVGEALRRHAGRSRVVVSPEGRVVERSGQDLREVDLLVGSGGALRNGRPGVADRVLGDCVGADVPGGWQLPRSPVVTVDRDYVLAAAGLLAGSHPTAAYLLVRQLLPAGDAAAAPTGDAVGRPGGRPA